MYRGSYAAPLFIFLSAFTSLYLISIDRISYSILTVLLNQLSISKLLSDGRGKHSKYSVFILTRVSQLVIATGFLFGGFMHFSSALILMLTVYLIHSPLLGLRRDLSETLLVRSRVVSFFTILLLTMTYLEQKHLLNYLLVSIFVYSLICLKTDFRRVRRLRV